MPTCSDPRSGERADPELPERVQLLLDLGLFEEASEEVRRRPGWDADPVALQQLGRILHRLAPQAKDRGGAYDRARIAYRKAADSTRDGSLRAELAADLGATYLEQGRLDEAVSELYLGRSLAPGSWRVHLGLLAAACAARDLAMIRRRAADLVEHVPGWHRDRGAVAQLATAPGLGLLRGAPQLFLECLGGYPDELRALHDRYCLEALEQALDDAGPATCDARVEGAVVAQGPYPLGMVEGRRRDKRTTQNGMTGSK